MNGKQNDAAHRSWLDLSGGEWLAASSLGVLIIGAVVFAIVSGSDDSLAGGNAIVGQVAPGPGDAAANFNLEPCLIPLAEIRSGGPAKDGIPALTRPETVSAASAGYLDGKERVIGVTIGDQARAYPLPILNWHENINDELGDKSIAVTYCPLCDSAVVFDRNIGGKTYEFGISGLLYNSNALLFDRQATTEEESLWSQLQLRAVSGPAAKAGLTLTPLPCELTTWDDWRSRYPETTVLSIDTGHTRAYDQNPYADYFKHESVTFPLNPEPSTAYNLRHKDRMVVAILGSQQRAYPIRALARAARDRGFVEDTLDDKRIRLIYDEASDSVRVEGVGTGAARPSVLYTFWFAWSTMHPDGDVFQSPSPPGPQPTEPNAGEGAQGTNE